MTTRELLENFSREEGIALFNKKKSDKEVYDILISKGLTDSFDTFTAETQKIFSEKVSKMSKEEILAQIEGAELSEEQLEQIAGGGKADDTTDDAVFLTSMVTNGVSILAVSAGAASM